MKAFELFCHYESFIRLMDSECFTPVQKLQLGHEMVTSLPPHQLCASTPNTSRLIVAAMRERLEKLNGTTATTSTEADAQPGKDAPDGRKGKNGKGQKPLHSPSGE